MRSFLIRYFALINSLIFIISIYSGVRNDGNYTQLAPCRGSICSQREFLPWHCTILLGLSRCDLQTATRLHREGELAQYRGRSAHLRRQVRPRPCRRWGPQVQAEEGRHPYSRLRPPESDDFDPLGHRYTWLEGLECPAALILQLYRVRRYGHFPTLQKDRRWLPCCAHRSRTLGVPSSVQILPRSGSDLFVAARAQSRILRPCTILMLLSAWWRFCKIFTFLFVLFI